MGLFKRKAEPHVIDLREQVAEVRAPDFAFGFPTRCPSCHGRGYLDHIDPFDRVQYEHCVDCGLKWETAETELLAPNS